MQEFYKDPVERDRWGRAQAGVGLYPTEKALVTKYILHGSRVLNIGCSGGREALDLAEMGYRVTAVDVDSEYVELTRTNAAARELAIECLVMDATKLEFPDSHFDAVVMVGQLIGHIRGRDRRLEALRQACRVVREDGVGLFSTNAIEASWKYRGYFALANLLRRVYNPHGLDPDDAFVFRQGGRRLPFLGRSGGPIFHWYRVESFTSDLAAAGWRPLTWVKRSDFEDDVSQSGSSGSGETFHVAMK